MYRVHSAIGPVQHYVFVHICRAVDLAENKVVAAVAVLVFIFPGKQAVHPGQISFGLCVGILPSLLFRLGLVGLALEGQGHPRHSVRDDGIAVGIHRVNIDNHRRPVYDGRIGIQ